MWGIKKLHSGFTPLGKFIHFNFRLEVNSITKKITIFQNNNLSVSLRGFTLIEVLLVVLLFGLLVTMGVPVYQRVQAKNDLEISSLIVINSLRRAQVLSQAVQNDDSWGVKVQNTNVTIFKGNNYISRTTSFDEVINFSGNNITISGLSELYFTKLIGLPSTSGTINVKINNNDNKNISINTQGTLSY